MVHALEAADFYRHSLGFLTIDVRSEGEFEHAHIPHAVNLPLFNNEERAVIGTLYKQQGRNDAIHKGLEMVGPKMAGFVQFVRDHIVGGKVFVHCWRGGMRSGSMAWLLSQMGWEVYTLKGGYKSFRNLVLESLQQPRNYALLTGNTGSGKTEVLAALNNAGEQVIDLEGLAHHKGSAFGALGQLPQPSTEQFENDLFRVLFQLNASKRIWVEDESKTIGTVYVHAAFLSHIHAAPHFQLHIPFDIRVQRLVDEYGKFSIEQLTASIEKIYKRLGDEHYRNAIAALQAGDLYTTTGILLRYYDKAYQFAIEKRKNIALYPVASITYSPDDMARALINQSNQLNKS